MKKIISICLALVSLISILSLTSCSQADIDLTRKSNVYDDFAKFINSPDDYAGKTVALTSTYMSVYNYSKNKVTRHTMVANDTTGKKRALYEIRTADGKYPMTGSDVTVYGTIHQNRYIEVERFSGEKYIMDFEIDALDLTPEELTSFINTYRTEYSASESYGKTIRIYGHLSTVEDGITFLVGLDGNGKYLWDIELYDPEGKFTYPSASGTEVNTVEVIGELGTYTSKNVIYACIKVQQVGKSESVFKEDIVINQ